jgi:hypothetical protein
VRRISWVPVVPVLGIILLGATIALDRICYPVGLVVVVLAHALPGLDTLRVFERGAKK